MLERTHLWLAVCALVAARPAFAQADAAAAEALFQDGKRLLDAGNVPEACSKLGESYRLDPGTGALLLLATCHEREGKLASAWAEYSEAASRARKEGGTDREAFAREKASALASRLSRLKVEVAPELLRVQGLRVERDGVEVGRASFGADIPVDGGAHVVNVTAPGYRPWTTSVRVGSEGDTLKVSVPALVPEPTAPGQVAPGSPSPALGAAQPTGLTGVQIAGIVTGGAGVVALGLGGYFSFAAVAKKDDSDAEGCDGNRCPGDAAELRRDAVTLADAATIASISGAVLVGTGVTLFVVGRRGTAPAQGRVELYPAPGGALVRGSF